MLRGVVVVNRRVFSSAFLRVPRRFCTTKPPQQQPQQPQKPPQQSHQPPPPPPKKEPELTQEERQKAYDEKKRQQEEELKRPPKFFWAFVIVYVSGTLVTILADYAKKLIFSEADFSTAAVDETEAQRIADACIDPKSVELLYKNGVAKLMVELLNSSNPDLRYSGHLIAGRLIDATVIMEDAIKQGLLPAALSAWLEATKDIEDVSQPSEQAQEYGFLVRSILGNYPDLVLRDKESVTAMSKLGKTQDHKYAFIIALVCVQAIIVGGKNVSLRPFEGQIKAQLADIQNVPKGHGFEKVPPELLEALEIEANRDVKKPGPPPHNLGPLLNAAGLAVGTGVIAFLYCRYRWSALTTKRALWNSKATLAAVGVSTSIVAKGISDFFSNPTQRTDSMQKINDNLRHLREKLAKGHSDKPYHYDTSPAYYTVSAYVIPTLIDSIYMYAWYFARYTVVPGVIATAVYVGGVLYYTYYEQQQIAKNQQPPQQTIQQPK